MKFVAILIITLSTMPEMVLCQKKHEQTLFPSKPPKGFYLRNVTFFLPADNTYIPALEYGIGVPNTPDTINLHYTTLKSLSDSLLTPYYFLPVGRGQQFHFELTGNTNVTVNAATYFQFARIAGNNKEFRVKGEAYFEIGQGDSSITIEAGEMVVKSGAGSTLNIFNYDKELFQIVSLEKGKLSLKQNRKEVQLNESGAEIWLRTGTNNIVFQHFNKNEINAWVRGEQRFVRMDLPYQLRSMSRWYNVIIDFEEQDLLEDRAINFPYRKFTVGEMIKAYGNLNPDLDIQMQGRIITFKKKRS